MGAGPVPGADSHWREIIDLVIDYNPTSALSFALNGDFDSETDFNGGTQSESWYGVNLGIKYVVADPFAIALRGEFFSDNHSGVVRAAPAVGAPTKHHRIGNADAVVRRRQQADADARQPDRHRENPIFQDRDGSGTLGKTMFTTTLGAIIATK